MGSEPGRKIRIHVHTQSVNEEAGCSSLWQNWGSRRREKVLAGDETIQTPRAGIHSPAAPASSTSTTGTADATFAQAGERARPVMPC